MRISKREKSIIRAKLVNRRVLSLFREHGAPATFVSSRTTQDNNQLYIMTTFTIPTRDSVSPATQQAFDGLQKMAGFVPNLFAAFGHSENGLPRYLAFQGAKTSLSNKEKEAINLVVSQVNGCRYCQSAHTAIGKMNGFSDQQILDIRAGHATDAKLNALVVLSKDITENKGHASAENLDAFYAAGYSQGNLVDVVLAVSDKIAANYLHNLTDLPIDWPLAAELEAVAA